MSLVVGINPPSKGFGTADASLSIARIQGFSFTFHPLTQTVGLPRSDLMSLSSSDWGNAIVGVVDPDQPVNPQFDFAVWLSIPAVVFPRSFLTNKDFPQILAAASNKLMATSSSVWVDVPLETPYSLLASLQTSSCVSNVGFNIIFPPKDSNLPSMPTLLASLNRLMGLTIRGMTLPTTLFLTNKKGYPALSKKMQVIMQFLIIRGRDKFRVVVDGPSTHAPSDQLNTADDYGFYLQYLQHLRSKPEICAVNDSEEAAADKAYLDYLQAPLQPLADHLEFQTYETFERDPVKYRNYQNAVYLALCDGMADGRWSKGHSVTNVTVAVVGAGRGPLVRGCLLALKQFQSENVTTKLKPRVVALEKNPSAVVYIQSLISFDPLFKDVEIVSGDMRKSGNPFTADIIVSELLGSFGDNELSPECLDGAQLSGLMTPSTISIPTDYVALVSPVSSLTLYNNAKAQGFAGACNPCDGPMGNSMGFQRAMETSYVVRSSQASQVNKEEECWRFIHPNPEAGKEGANERSCDLEFELGSDFGLGYGSGYGEVDRPMRAALDTQEMDLGGAGGIIVHGLSGTFDSLLYRSEATGREERISIAPETFSVGMFSWFPLFFPLRDPLFVPEGGKMGVKMWRKVSEEERAVWFEWQCSVFDGAGNLVSASHVHNVNGRSAKVGL